MIVRVGSLRVPNYTGSGPQPSSTANRILIDGASEAGGQIFHAPATGAIRYIWWELASWAPGATPPTLALEGVDANGDPNGTPLATPVNLTGLANGHIRTDLGASGVSVTEGQLLAATWRNPATGFGTLRVQGTICSPAVGDGQPNRIPYSDSFTTAWTKSSGLASLMVEYTDGSVWPVTDTIGNFVSHTINNAQAHVGNRITLPVRAEVIGLWSWADLDNPTRLRWYGPDGTLWVDRPITGGTSRGLTTPGVTILWISPRWVDAGITTSVIVAPDSASGSVMYQFTLWNPISSPTLADQVLPWAGHVVAVTGTAWPFAETADGKASQALCGLIVRQLDVPTPSSRNRVLLRR